MNGYRMEHELADDGWIRLWEAIYERPWPLRDRETRAMFAAWCDWRRDQDAPHGDPRTHCRSHLPSAADRFTA